MKEWDGCKCFRAFHTVLSKQKLLQLVLWNKQAALKKQGNNCFRQINALCPSNSNRLTDYLSINKCLKPRMHHTL